MLYLRTKWSSCFSPVMVAVAPGKKSRNYPGSGQDMCPEQTINRTLANEGMSFPILRFFLLDLLGMSVASSASAQDGLREKQLSCGLHRSTACAAPIPPAPWRFRCRRGLPPQRTHGSPDHSELRARDQGARPLQALPFRY